MKMNITEFVDSYNNADKANRLLLDVRNPDEVAAGSIKGSVNVPLPEIENHLQKIPKDKDIYIFCRSGGRAEKAEMFLIHKGYKLTHFLTSVGYDEIKDKIK